MTAKWDFDPLEKVISNRIGKLKLQNARVPLSVIVKLSYEMIYEPMSFTPTCMPAELNQSLHHTGRNILKFWPRLSPKYADSVR